MNSFLFFELILLIVSKFHVLSRSLRIELSGAKASRCLSSGSLQFRTVECSKNWSAGCEKLGIVLV